MNVKALLPIFVAVLAALIVYDLVVKGMLPTNKYDDTLDHFDGLKKSDAKFRKLYVSKHKLAA